MNYTEKYHLPQWVETDRIMMDDFNAAMASIEGGLTAVKGEAAQDASGLSQRLDTVEQTAEEAHEKAYTPPFVIGNYIGLDEAKTFTVGFRPSMVIIWGDQPGADVNTMGRHSGVVVETPSNVWSGLVGFTDTGFTLVKPREANVYPKLMEYAHYYVYAAFR